jgi:hypothetical protein
MSEIERLEAEYRSLATSVIYAGFEGQVDPLDRAQLERLSDELIRLNAADFSVATTSGQLALT